MYKDSGKPTKTSQVILQVLAMGSLVESALLFGRMRRHLYPEYAKYQANQRMEKIINRLGKQGWLSVEYREAKRIIRLTKRGELEALFQKAKLSGRVDQWDGKWRMIVFDIPENARAIRDQLRGLLKKFGFRALQASVYVYPFPLNAGAVEFLKGSGLMRYIRVVKVEAFDDDSDLRRLFRGIIPKTHGREKWG